jgi:SMI1 / KNR4 family (SUKH-1)
VTAKRKPGPVSIEPGLALALGKLRETAEHKLAPPRVRIQDIDAVEKELGIPLPNAVIAYLGCGVSAFGDGPLAVRRILELTRDVADAMEDSGDTPSGVLVFDDDSNGNYVGLNKTGQVLFLDHETAFSDDTPISLKDEIDKRLERADEEGADLSGAQPLTVELFDKPDPPPVVRFATHKKFGRGKVVSESGDAVTVAFPGVGEKRIQRSFLVFDP